MMNMEALTGPARPVAGVGEKTFTYAGVASKIGVLFLLLLSTTGIGVVFPNGPLFIVSIVAALVISFVIYRKPEIAGILGSIGALFLGYIVGVLSVYMYTLNAAQGYSGVVPVAIAGTLAVFVVMLTLYATRVIRMSQTLIAASVGAGIAVGVTYLTAFIASFFWPGVSDLPIFRLQQAPLVGIVFSAVVIVILAFNLAVAFHFTEQNVEDKAPRKYEWAAAYAILTTLVWIYIEMLRLLTKIYNR